jgi:hypothetical protein
MKTKDYTEFRYILEKDRVYNTTKKQEVRDLLIDKYILPRIKKGKGVNVLDFFGTGLFVERLNERLNDQNDGVQNQVVFV